MSPTVTLPPELVEVMPIQVCTYGSREEELTEQLTKTIQCSLGVSPPIVAATPLFSLGAMWSLPAEASSVPRSTVSVSVQQVAHSNIETVPSLPLNRLITLSETGKREEAIDLAIDFFDDLLIKNKLAECDLVFLAIDDEAMRKLSVSVLVSILGITVKARGLLKFRPMFFNRTWKQVSRVKGRAYAKKLLSKYK